MTHDQPLRRDRPHPVPRHPAKLPAEDRAGWGYVDSDIDRGFCRSSPLGPRSVVDAYILVPE